MFCLYGMRCFVARENDHMFRMASFERLAGICHPLQFAQFAGQQG